jgi:hypothetical protein
MAVGAQIGRVLKTLGNSRIEVNTVKFSSGTTAVFTSTFSRFVVLGLVGTTSGVSYTGPTGTPAMTPSGTPTVQTDGGYVNPQASTTGGTTTNLTITASATDSGYASIALLAI